MSARAVVKGLLTRLPYAGRILPRGRTGGSDSARYCVAVWIRHLRLMQLHGIARVPESVVEVGPGDTLGVGFAAIATGVKRVIAVDAVPYADTASNLRVLNEISAMDLVDWMRPAGAPHWLQRHADPEGAAARAAGAAERAAPTSPLPNIEKLRDIARFLQGASGSRMTPTVEYVAPWAGDAGIAPCSVDAVLSQAVMQHATDPAAVYRACHRWLRPGGILTLEIDFKSHGLARTWNGHLAFSRIRWALMTGRRAYLLNRLTCSEHLALIRASGFEVLSVYRNTRRDGLPASRLARQWRSLGDDDLTCSEAVFVARRPGS